MALDLLLTHTHLDHILGLPFFQPLYQPDTRVSIYGPAISPEDRLEQVIGGQMSYRYFPVRQVELAAEISYVDLREGAYDLGDGIRLSATYLNHPLLCMGYRIEYRDRVLCTAFDTEPFRNVFITDPADPRYDEMMAQEGEQAVQAAALRMNAFLRGADLLIHDGQFTEQEYRAGRVGWGHSSVEHAIGLAEASGARRLALVHHDPMRTDPELDRLAAARTAACGRARGWRSASRTKGCQSPSNRVLKNKHQAVSQGVRRFGKRSPPAADEHLQKPHNAGYGLRRSFSTPC